MPEPTPAAGELVEVADRCWFYRAPWFAANVGVIAGDRGVVVVDTLPEEMGGSRFAELIDAPVVAIVNTHAHFDHTLGNRAFVDRWPTAKLIAHEAAALATESATEELDQHFQDDPELLARLSQIRPLAADHTLTSVRVIDLGDRVVELIHPGPGHSPGDVVIWVPEVSVLYAGDLVEESGPPQIGPDADLLGWIGALDLVGQMIAETVRIVPGHGNVVDKVFLTDQRFQLADRLPMHPADSGGRRTLPLL